MNAVCAGRQNDPPPHLFFNIFDLCLGSQVDGPYPVASTTLGIHQQVLLGRGSPVGLCPHSPMLMTTVVSRCYITLVTFGCGLVGWKCVA